MVRGPVTLSSDMQARPAGTPLSPLGGYPTDWSRAAALESHNLREAGQGAFCSQLLLVVCLNVHTFNVCRLILALKLDSVAHSLWPWTSFLTSMWFPLKPKFPRQNQILQNLYSSLEKRPELLTESTDSSIRKRAWRMCARSLEQEMNCSSALNSPNCPQTEWPPGSGYGVDPGLIWFLSVCYVWFLLSKKDLALSSWPQVWPIAALRSGASAILSQCFVSWFMSDSLPLTHCPHPG